MTILKNNLKAIKELNDNLTKLAKDFPDKRMSFEGVALVGEKDEYINEFPDDQAVHFARGFRTLRNLAFSRSMELDDLQKIIQFKILASIPDDDSEE